MATLPQITLDFNRKIKLSHDGGELFSDTGEMVFQEKLASLRPWQHIYSLLMNDATTCMRIKIYFVRKSINSSLDIKA
ncbi:hypothetical protein J18TS1_27880 [Oceanobacillus oncorhynchi subsp. incaldanensis]|nr:hypothetical protein J18TS1_27880 [Oceanobacillus oncorhynchi subsp. incaldanensis]